MGKPVFDLKKRAAVLASLRQGYSISHACREVGVSSEVLHNRMRGDAGLAQLVQDAIASGTEFLEDEARRRATAGFEEPVYQGGAQVGTIRKYSDTLLIFLLKGRNPGKYKDRVDLSNADGSLMAPLAAAIRKANGGAS